MTEELKHCPFCGGNGSYSNAGFGFIVKCRKCGSKTSIQESGKEAAEAWNTRQIENELVEKIEKLEAENKRLREALEEIKNTVKEEQYPVYSFHFDLDRKHGAFILETAENALKWNGNV